MKAVSVGSTIMLEVYLLEELAHRLSVIGISENKIIQAESVNLKPTVPGYEFEYVKTALASGGIGMYIKAILITWP